jgi:hypothetical protein
MKDFILIDFLIEKVKKLFQILETHQHDSRYYTKEEFDAKDLIKQHPNSINFDYKIQEGNNAILSGPFEIKNGFVLEIPKGSTASVV